MDCSSTHRTLSHADGLFRVSLAHSHDVPAYPMVHSVSRAGGFEDKAVWRGDVLWRMWEGGAGVYTFNTFDPHLWLWWELGDPQTMAGKDRAYTWDYLPSQRDESDVLPVVRLTRYRRPLRVTSAGAEPILVFAGEDFAAPTPGGARREIELLVHVKGIAKCQQLLVILNGVPLKQAGIPEPSGYSPKAATFRSRPDPQVLAPGKNRLDARVVGGGAVTIDDVRLQVHFESNSNSVVG